MEGRLKLRLQVQTLQVEIVHKKQNIIAKVQTFVIEKFSIKKRDAFNDLPKMLQLKKKTSVKHVKIKKHTYYLSQRQ